MFVENGNVPTAADTPFVVGTYIASGNYSSGFQIDVGFAPSMVMVQASQLGNTQPAYVFMTYLIGKATPICSGWGEVGSLTQTGFRVMRPECVNTKGATYNYIAFR